MLTQTTQYMLQSFVKCICNLLGLTGNLDLKSSLMLPFGYFQQDNYKIEFLVTRLGTRL